MILPNVFQKHNIEYLSASTINTWVEQPALALLKIAGIKDKVAGPSAWRGIAVDEALTGIIFNEDYTESKAIDKAIDTFEENESQSEDMLDAVKVAKEKDTIVDYVKVGRAFYRTLKSKPLEFQGKIEWQMDDIEVPFIGYFDLLYKDYVRDIKTTRVAPVVVTRKAQRQLSLYSKATKKDPHVDYITRKEVRSFKITNVDNAYKDLERATNSLKAVLSHSDDIFECCKLVHPDLDHWMWGDVTRAKAKEVWEI